MSFETALFDKLSSGVTLVGSRIYAGVAPQGTATPFIVYSKVSAEKQYAHSGAGGLTRDRLQVSVYSTGYLAAKKVVKQVETALESWPSVQAAFKQNELDLRDEATNLFHVPVDYFIWHNIATTT